MRNSWKFLSYMAVLAVAALGLSVSTSGCARRRNSGKLKIAAGLPPVAYLAERIGGDAVEVKTMLMEGRSPHDYSPNAAEMREAAYCRLFLSTGMNFEEKLERALQEGGTRIVDVSRGIERIPMEDSCGHDHHDHDHDHDGLDPHVWLNVENACRMAENIRDEFCRSDPAHADLYRKNCEDLIRELRECEKQLKTDMAPYKGKCFYVQHPAFGYYAKMLGLKQVAMADGGRDLTPDTLNGFTRRVKDDRCRIVFTQPQFNPASVRALTERGLKTVEADPLRYDLIDNFKDLGRELKAAFAESGNGGAK